MKGTVIAAVDDLFFAAKIRATAESTGASLRLCRGLEATVEAARELNSPLVIVDLHARQFDPLQLARTIKADSGLSETRLMGFFSHVQTALMHEAKDAGFDYVLPRSAFSSRLAEILKGKLPE